MYLVLIFNSEMPVKAYWMYEVKYISHLFSTLNPTTIWDSANNVRQCSEQCGEWQWLYIPSIKNKNNHSRVPGNTAHPITTAQVSTGQDNSARVRAYVTPGRAREGWRGSTSCCRSVYIYINSPSKKFSPQGGFYHGGIKSYGNQRGFSLILWKLTNQGNPMAISDIT